MRVDDVPCSLQVFVVSAFFGGREETFGIVGVGCFGGEVGKGERGC